ncbi:hypothetical protein PHMEG_00016935 [Phytophthora megakarya]|uniref:Uncharacterized protein n=1 Tax=Phytophthora megakarya TaxID=4795 RepID=A0A225VXH9_9STRA|nr:hypothetical protein PHMEG_00016935 [Phytophthora megakarya]
MSFSTVANNCMLLMVDQSTRLAASSHESLHRVLENRYRHSHPEKGSATLKTERYAYRSTQMGLNIDPFGSVCPDQLRTHVIHNIDDVNATATLGLNTIENALNGNASSWRKVGDNAVIIEFSTRND